MNDCMTILAIDSETDARIELEELVDYLPMNYEVLVAANFEIAAMRANDRSVAAVVLGVNGSDAGAWVIEQFEALKAAYPKVTIILYMGEDCTELLTGYHFGAAQIVPKPFANALIRTIISTAHEAAR